MKAIVYFTKTLRSVKDEEVNIETFSEFNDIGEAEDIAHSMKCGVFDVEHLTFTFNRIEYVEEGT